MFEENKLWKDRSGQRIKDIGKYLRYIFNGHLMIVLLFLIGSAAFYYQKWVKTLPEDFPAASIMALVLGFLLTYSPVYNFLLEADKVFLLPLENKLNKFFFRAGIVSLIFQGYILLMIQAVLMPIFAQVSGKGFGLFIPFFAVLLVVKAWNMAVGWKVQYEVDQSVHVRDFVVRFFVNAVFVYLLFNQANFLLLGIMSLIIVLYYLYFKKKSEQKGLKWDDLITQEEKRMASFYRLANMFTDVPKLKDSVKRRIWLDIFLRSISFSSEKTFHYLFSRTFLRTGDYLGLFLRLTVIGGLAIYFLSFGWGQVLLSVLFLYLTGFQLLPLWNHHQNKLWVDLYPVMEKNKAAAFFFILSVVLCIQAFLFALLILVKGEFLEALVSLAVGLIFTYYFVYIYSNKRIKKPGSSF